MTICATDHVQHREATSADLRRAVVHAMRGPSPNHATSLLLWGMALCLIGAGIGTQSGIAYAQSPLSQPVSGFDVLGIVVAGLALVFGAICVVAGVASRRRVPLRRLP